MINVTTNQCDVFDKNFHHYKLKILATSLRAAFYCVWLIVCHISLDSAISGWECVDKAVVLDGLQNSGVTVTSAYSDFAD